jgi:nicotinamide-nucleotide amidase
MSPAISTAFRPACSTSLLVSAASSALGVPTPLLDSRGAVCGEVAAAMAEGALARTPTDLAVAITGVAGPEPDEDGNPVGLVCIAVASKGKSPVVAENH